MNSVLTPGSSLLNTPSQSGAGTGRRKIGKTDYQALGVLYLPEPARFASLLKLTEGANIVKAINEAMKAIEDDNEHLKSVLSKTYTVVDNASLCP